MLSPKGFSNQRKGPPVAMDKQGFEKNRLSKHKNCKKEAKKLKSSANILSICS